MNKKSTELPKLHQRFQLVRPVDRFPDFLVQSGANGTVIASGNLIIGKMDQHIPGAEAWDNCIHWEDVEEYIADAQALADTALAKLCDE